MKNHDLLSILITFVVGVFVGGYLYTTSFAGFVARLETPDVEKVSEFTIVGEVYGGCREACPSFQVINDGSYRYLYTPYAGADQVVRKGTLPFQLQRNLRAVLTKNALIKQSQVRQPSVCNSYSDGIDVKYEIVIDGQEFILDSCGTTVDGGGDLWATLGSVWDYYEDQGNKD